MSSPSHSTSSGHRPERGLISIGRNRQTVLLCAWIGCVLLFVVTAARTFYTSGTTSQLAEAEGTLKQTPSVSTPSLTEPADGAILQTSAAGLNGTNTYPVAATGPDSYYGRQLQPSKQPQAASPDQQPATGYSFPGNPNPASGQTVPESGNTIQQLPTASNAGQLNSVYPDHIRKRLEAGERVKLDVEKRQQNQQRLVPVNEGSQTPSNGFVGGVPSGTQFSHPNQRQARPPITGGSAPLTQVPNAGGSAPTVAPETAVRGMTAPIQAPGNQTRANIPQGGDRVQQPSTGLNSRQPNSVYPEHIRKRLDAGERVKLNAETRRRPQRFLIPYHERTQASPNSVMPGPPPPKQYSRPDRRRIQPPASGGSAPLNQVPSSNKQATTNSQGTALPGMIAPVQIDPRALMPFRGDQAEPLILGPQTAQQAQSVLPSHSFGYPANGLSTIPAPNVAPEFSLPENIPSQYPLPQTVPPTRTATPERPLRVKSISNGAQTSQSGVQSGAQTPAASAVGSVARTPDAGGSGTLARLASQQTLQIPAEGFHQQPRNFAAPGQPVVIDTMPQAQLFPLNNQPHAGWSTLDRPDNATRWWEPKLSQSLFPDRPPLTMTLGSCLSLALTESPELQVLHSEWYIQQAEADRLAAAFDWNTFVEAIWNRDSNPVGSDLDGATDRLRSRTASASFGVRRVTETGAQVELSQQFGTRSGNSIFLNPNPQANSRLALEYEKPLLRGFGRDYNTSPQRLAVIDKDTAYDRFRIGVQDYLLNVSSAYWTLVLQRGLYLQAEASLQRVQEIASEMETRTEVDVTPGMLDRARSEVAIRKANVVQTKYNLLRTQAALLRLVYGSNFDRYAGSEVLTLTIPPSTQQPVTAEPRIQTAMQQRSEVHQSIREIKAATIRYEVAANEVLPALNFVMTGYVAGLQPENRINDAWVQQFEEGEPGVGLGFDFEVPYRNRAAQAAAERQQITIKRMQAALQTTLADVAENVRVQVIERNKQLAMLPDQNEAIVRARSMLRNANIRRANLADGTRVADLYLEDLLQIQNRLESAESAFLQSQVRFALADNALLRATSQIDTLADSSAPTSLPLSTPDFVPAQPGSGHSFGQ